MSAHLTVADVLDRAADLIEPEGAWGSCYCAATALWGAASGGAMGCRVPLAVSAEHVLASQVGADEGDLPYSIYRWNDAPGRRKSHVVKALRKAAALAREQGK